MERSRTPEVWCITRERLEAERVCEELCARGGSALAVPLIERVVLRAPPALRPGDLVFLTSAFAARAMGALDVAVAATDASARALGREPEVCAVGGATRLAQAVVESNIACARIVYPTSDVGLVSTESLNASAILAQVAPLERFALYATRPRPEPLRALPRDRPLGVYFASPSAVAVWDETPVVSVVCLGRSTADAWQKQPTPRVVASEAEAISFMLAAR